MNNIHLEGYMRYMDDGRAFLAPIKPGWRWWKGELLFKEAWRQEDKNLSGVEITRAALEQSMQEVFPFLRFTTEVGEGEECWLPTLDTQIRVEQTNLISYKHYEKPTTTNIMVQKRTSMDENSKNQILANDLVRRLGNTDVRQPRKVVAEVVDMFGKKLLTSGYSMDQTRRIVLSGIRGWERKKSVARAERRTLFRTSAGSLSGRLKKKTIGRTTWYRKKKNTKKDSQEDRYDKKTHTDAEIGSGKYNSSYEDPDIRMEKTNAHSTTSKKKGEDKEVKTSAVLFVENTKEGRLAKNLREVVERLKGILGYRIKVVERSGTSLKMMFPLSRIGEGRECGKDDCTTCTQERGGEDNPPPCNKRNVLYENICRICNPG